MAWIDNTVYYRLVPDRPRYYQDFAGTGNTLDVRHPQVLRLVMDSLRYWVEEMHVDGFRFDLASALARDESAFNRSAPFFEAIHQDPVLSRVKLIAEPWDIAEGGYQTGNYPLLWSEWNDKFRDGVRSFWRGDAHTIGDMGFRLTGSSDLFEDDDRPTTASINYVTAHDGFTLEDLVSYEHKHNEANSEHNRDGADHNRSANYGVEGPTTDPAIHAVRNRQKRNFLATLLFSQGVPMLCGGDELGRTQRGNNNAYCQDNEISWFDWDLDPDDAALLTFTQRLVQLRAEHPVLRRRTFFLGRSVGDSPAKDLIWFRPDGAEMSATDWANGGLRAIGLRLAGDAIAETDEQGNRVVDETLLLLLNAEPSPLTFTLPRFLSGRPGCWEELLDTADPEQLELRRYDGGSSLVLSDRSLKLCRRWPSPMPQAADR
jgi:glycogen operon protein